MAKLIDKIKFNEIEFLMFVLDELADELSKDGKDVIKLTLGKAQEPLHPRIVSAWVDAVKDENKRNLVYPEGLPELRQKIAEWYQSLGNNVKKENILINTGTSPFFKDLFRLLVEENDEILLPEPYYSVYYVCALLTGAKVKYYHVDPETLKIDMDDFRAKYNPEKTRFVIMCSPGNPYGNILSAKDYQEIINITSSNTYLLSDEIYRNTGFRADVTSILDVATKKDINSRIIITNSFSKGFRMYTARVGFAILPDKLLLPYRVMLQHALLATNPTEQFACIEALNHLDEVKKLAQIYSDRNDYVVKKLAGIDGVKVIPAEGGFYLVVMCGDFMAQNNIFTSFDLAKDILEKTGVAVVPGSDFGVPKGLRISFTHLRFNEAIDRLKQYFSRT